MEQQSTDNMKVLATNIGKLTYCITDVFSAMKNNMMRQQYMPTTPMGLQYPQQPMPPMGYQHQLQQEQSNYPPMNVPSQNAPSYSQQFNYLDSEHGQVMN